MLHVRLHTATWVALPRWDQQSAGITPGAAVLGSGASQTPSQLTLARLLSGNGGMARDPHWAININQGDQYGGWRALEGNIEVGTIPGSIAR